MARFLVTYHGGGAPPTDPAQAARMKEAFGNWVARSGRAIVDPGAPVRSAGQVANGSPGPEIVIGGYSVIEAASAAEAIALLKTHPFVDRGGTLQLHESVTV